MNEALFVNWRWVAPSVAAFSVALLLLGNNPSGFTSIAAETSTGVVATTLAHYSRHNAWPRTTFEWTNGAGSLTNPSSLGTNGLLQ